MAAPLPFSESELRLLRSLLKRKVKFMVVGLSAAPVVTQDIDLWFETPGEERMCRALREVGAAYVPPSAINPPMLAGAGAELFDVVPRMDGLGAFAEEIKNCVTVPLGREKLKVLSLERILVSKVAANRPKDKLTIPVLRDALAATQSVKRRAKTK